LLPDIDAHEPNRVNYPGSGDLRTRYDLLQAGRARFRPSRFVHLHFAYTELRARMFVDDSVAHQQGKTD